MFSRERRGRPKSREALFDAVRLSAVRRKRIRGGTAYFTPSVRLDRGRFFLGLQIKLFNGGGENMIQEPVDVLKHYEVRKNSKQKTPFISAVIGYAQSQNYCKISVEKEIFGCRNIVIGDPAKAKYLITAHYDTCAHLPFPNFITPCNLLLYLAYQILVTAGFFLLPFLLLVGLTIAGIDFTLSYWISLAFLWLLLFLMMFGPANRHTANDNTSGVVTLLEILRTLPDSLRDQVCFVLFDMEELGLIGSAAYRSRHKNQTQNQIILNLDCVGDGDEIVMFPSRKLRKSKTVIDELERLGCQCGSKKLYLHKKGLAICPSDQSNFPHSVGIMAFHRKKFMGIYCSRIHTNKDTILDYKNVNILRAAIISMIGNCAVQEERK